MVFGDEQAKQFLELFDLGGLDGLGAEPFLRVRVLPTPASRVTIAPIASAPPVSDITVITKRGDMRPTGWPEVEIGRGVSRPHEHAGQITGCW